VRFSQSTYSVGENSGPVQPVLVLSNPSSTDITVKILYTDITALGKHYSSYMGWTIVIAYDITGGGIDYDSGPYTVTFYAGQTIVLFNVFIIDDSILEKNEMFILNIDIASLPKRVIVDSPREATVITIVDDDGKYIVLLIIKWMAIYT